MLHLFCVATIHAQQDSKVTLDEVLAGIGAFESRLLSKPSLLFEYDQHREYPNAPEGQQVLDVHFVNAKKGDMYFTSWVDDTDPPVSTWLAWKKPIGTYRFQSALHITPEPDPNLWDQSHYAHALFVDCFKGLEVSNSTLMALIRAVSFSDATPLALPKSIQKNKAEWKVRSQPEIVDSAKCLVIERKDRDIIWIDPKLGYVCRRRIYYESNGNKLLEVINRDFIERASGLWLPNEQVVTRFNPSFEPPDLRGKSRVKETNRLVRVSFDPLPDSFFDIPLPTENGFVLDHVRGIHYPMHPEGSTAEGIIAKPLRLAKEVIERRNVRKSTIRWIVLSSAVLLGIVILALQIARFRAIGRRRG